MENLNIDKIKWEKAMEKFSLIQDLTTVQDNEN